MTLYTKTNGAFIAMSAADETAIRADQTNMIANDGGYDVVMPDNQAQALKAEWAANASAPKPPPQKSLADRVAALEVKAGI